MDSAKFQRPLELPARFTARSPARSANRLRAASRNSCSCQTRSTKLNSAAKIGAVAVVHGVGEGRGCYLYLMGRRTPLSEPPLANAVDVSWWVTPDAYDRGEYETLYRALDLWVTAGFPFRAPHYSNAKIPHDDV